MAKQIQNLTDWLLSEAGAGWVFGIVSTLALIVSWLRRAGPNRLVVRETKNLEPVNVRKNLKPRITIRFDDVLVDNLSQVEIKLFNSGGNIIKSPIVTITFSEGVRILDAAFLETREGAAIQIDENHASIHLPFLNPYRDLHHVEQVTFLLSGKSERIGAVGMGEGWSILHIRIPTAREQSRTMNILMMLLGGWLVSIFVYVRWLNLIFGITVDEWSWRACLAVIPIFLSALFLFLWGYRSSSRRVVRN